MEDRWNDIDKRKLKYPEKKLLQCLSFHHRSHMAGLGLNWSLQGKRPATNQLSCCMVKKVNKKIADPILNTIYEV